MEKKEYIKPSAEVIEIDATQMLCASNEFGITDEITKEDADLSNGRRGQWGNLWYTEER